MNDHDLITYLLAINMTDLGFFPLALSEVAEGDIVSISYGSRRAVNLMTALRCTVHKDAYGPGAYRTYVDTPLGASVTLYYHDPSNPGADPHVRSIVIHDSDDLSRWTSPIGAVPATDRTMTGMTTTSTTDAVIEAAARCLLNSDGWREWDELGSDVKNGYLRNARALHAAGFLVDELRAK